MLVARERTIPRLSPERQDRSHMEYESSTGDEEAIRRVKLDSQATKRRFGISIRIRLSE